MAAEAGLVKLGHVAIDGTKLKANASKHNAMSYGRMKIEEQRLAREVDTLLEQAAANDPAEDKAYGPEGGWRLQWYCHVPHRMEKAELLLTLRGTQEVLDGVSVRGGCCRYRAYGPCLSGGRQPAPTVLSHPSARGGPTGAQTAMVGTWSSA